jgi:hypothetical protein
MAKSSAGSGRGPRTGKPSKTSSAKPAPKAGKAPVAAKPPKAKAKKAGRGARRPRGEGPPKEGERTRVSPLGGRSGRSARRPRVAKVAPPAAPPESVLSEEDAIRSAKYLPRDLPPRLFEEERFLFPESYGVNRVRLLVKDPEWLFAYWDVNPASLGDLGEGLGERALALSRLTLRIKDPVHGGSSDILLPPGARWWYVRGDSAPRSYRAELGVTLPSGEFRRLAESNTVVTPRVGPSSQKATRRMTYAEAQAMPPQGPWAAEGADETRGSADQAVGPWQGPSGDGVRSAPGTPGEGTPAGPGGASDAFRPGGASDVFRR